MDVNNDLNCSILTAKDVEQYRNESLGDAFQKGWNTISSELPGRIEIKSCCFESDERKAPIHDRWWLFYDADNDKYKGLRMASPSTMGSRITEVSDMDDDAIASANMIWVRFFQNMVLKAEQRKLKYDETRLR